MSHIPQAQGEVLPTLNRDGSRKRLRPRRIKGRFYRYRMLVAWGLVALFVLCPVLTLNGKPLILLDLPRRQFTFFGTTLLATDTMMLMLALVSLVLAIFLVTALFGRVWCGWACPQTVYLEFLYRPLERLLERRSYRKVRKSDNSYGQRMVLKYAVFALLSLVLAHVFLSYFVPLRELLTWLTRSPLQHPASFMVMAATSGLIFFDFAYFREQTCIVACPYGRFQSALLDRHSLIVGYDERRGEPRGKKRKKDPEDAPPKGDCIDCKLCTQVCPVGIDIRDGLQMECLTCTSCVDACDSIMDKIGKPRGLVRYTSQDEQAGEPRRLLRPRVVIYPALMAVAIVGLGLTLGRQAPADITLLRGIGAPFALQPGGQVTNQIRVKVVNRSGQDRQYKMVLKGAPDAQMVAPQNPLPVADGKSATTPVFITLPRSAFTNGELRIQLQISDGGELNSSLPYRLLGPGKRTAGAGAAGEEAS